MNDYLPKSLDEYKGKEFLFSERAFKYFYIEMFDILRAFVCSKGYVSGKKNFKDLFQTAMLKFYQLAKGGMTFGTYDDAIGMAQRLFYFAMVDDFRKTRKIILLSLPENMHVFIKEETEVQSDSTPLNKKIERVFGEMDKAIRANPYLLTEQQFEFYELYKAIKFHPINEHDTARIITAKMNIKLIHFRKLKSELKAKFRELIRSMNIFIHS